MIQQFILADDVNMVFLFSTALVSLYGLQYGRVNRETLPKRFCNFLDLAAVLVLEVIAPVFYPNSHQVLVSASL